MQFIDNGSETSILLVEMCFNRFTIYREDLKSMFVEPAIAALFGKLMEKPHFVTVFSHVVLTHTPISEEFIDDLSNSLQLSAYEKKVLNYLINVTEPWVYFSCRLKLGSFLSNTQEIDAVIFQ